MRKNGKSKRPSGRPTHKETLVIQKDIRKYFDDGLSAQFCINETGYAKNTVYAYYKEWTEELIDRTDWIEQQKATIVRVVAALDKSIKTFNDQRDFLHSKRTDKFNAALENTIAKNNYMISKIHLDKANVLLTPTLDITLRKLIKDRWGIDIEEISQDEQQKASANSAESS